LKDHKVQEEYRAFIQEKLDAHLEANHGGDEKKQREQEQNLLILFRKLREGIQSSNRADPFALEVYETSLHLSIIFYAPVQTTSILSHLLPDLYRSIAPEPSPSIRGHRALPTAVLSLLHNLVSGYPSQSRYFEQLHSLPRTFMPRTSDAYRWLCELTRCLRGRNYARLNSLTCPEVFRSFAPTPVESHEADAAAKKGTETRGQDHRRDLYSQAMGTLVNALREKARETAWLVLRSAYREFACPPAAGSELPDDTSQWLARSLVLLPAGSGNEQKRAVAIKAVNEWLEERSKEGEVRKKDGMEGRWVVCKVGSAKA